MKKYLSLIVVGILFVACQPTNELGTPFQKGQEVSLTASIGEQRPQMLPGMQRVSGKDDGDKINLTWDEGDQILVKVGDKSSEFTLIAGAGTGEGVFAGAMPADGSSFDVEYPVEYSDEVLKEQTYVENGFGKGLMKMSTQKAGTLNEGFTLSSDNALLGLQLTGNQILGKIVLTDLASEATYTLHCDEVTLKEEVTLFYIVVPVAGWTAGMLVVVYDQDGRVILSKKKEGKIDFTTKEAMVMPSLEARGPGKRIGVFSVGEGKYVSFSQGNLQYIQSTKTWQFAKEQWEILGEANKEGYSKDLFDWNQDETRNFVDWGMHIIQGDKPDTWRTLSIDEWKYILYDRTNATNLLACAIIENIVGVVIFPEGWQCPEGMQFTTVADEIYTWDEGEKMYYFKDNVFKHNVIHSATWKELEETGAVFLPTAGFIKQGELYSCGTVARTWSSTRHQNSKGYYISFGYSPSHDYSIRTYSNINSDDGHSVRLVHDTIPPVLTFTVEGVSFDMIYVEGGTFTMGTDDESAPENERPAHPVTLSDYYMAETHVSQALWKEIMGTSIDDEVSKNNGDKDIGRGDNYPMYCITWFQANEFAERLSERTGQCFRLPTEAEWEYAARGGRKSNGFKFAGSNSLDEVAWWGDPEGRVHESALKKPNELGIYDMCGNICEWTLDGYSKYTSAAQKNPKVERIDDVVQRSMSSHASWKEADHRITFRYKKDPNHARTRVGIRLCLVCSE